MDDPGCVAGSLISPMPQRGPEASQRTSLAILSKLPPWSSEPAGLDNASFAALGLEVVLRFRQTAIPVLLETPMQPAPGRNPGCVLIPVPTAVPPDGQLASVPPSAFSNLRRPFHLACEPAELLAQPNRSRVLQGEFGRSSQCNSNSFALSLRGHTEDLAQRGNQRSL